MTNSSPHPVDLHVGQRIRLRRKLVGASQTQVAEALGLTFQQLQKYERGTNRISASKLHALALHMQVPISWFFEGLEEPAADNTVINRRQAAVDAFLATREGLELAFAFPGVRPGQRNQILALVRTLAADEEFAQDT
ncbi:MAG: helix-turn-helix domain-containing protein [Alphaproteobacteria bacterium]|nr:helix-turn-helix domain-containing protein [Alphaproteobacteria bacterium]